MRRLAGDLEDSWKDAERESSPPSYIHEHVARPGRPETRSRRRDLEHGKYAVA